MDKDPAQYLTKTRFMKGLQCPKLLWYYFNRKEDIPPLDESTRAMFDIGNKIGEYAQKLYPEGLRVEWSRDLKLNAERTLSAVEQRKPLFESAAIYNGAYAQADILVPAGENGWDIIEVKASGEVKPEHNREVAFQKFVYEKAGICIDRCYLMRVNKDYVRMGEIEPEKLLIMDELSDRVAELMPDIEKSIETMFSIIRSIVPPESPLGRQCSSPYECPLSGLCQKYLPEENVLGLRGDRKGLRFDLISGGILKMADIPEDRELSEDQRTQISAARSGKDHINKDEVISFLNKLKFPLYFLDFETINMAIPPYDGTRPFEFITFQFSLHVIKKEGAKPAHYSYIDPGEVDPRPEVFKRLKGLLGTSGSILAWYCTFEKSRIREAGERFKEFAEWAENTNERFIDLLEPFSKLYYYSPKQNGSASLKDVYPALIGKSYEGLEIDEGGKAMLEYYRVTFDKNVSEEERKAVYSNLEIYCTQDTRAMVEILDILKKKVAL